MQLTLGTQKDRQHIFYSFITYAIEPCNAYLKGNRKVLFTLP